MNPLLYMSLAVLATAARVLGLIGLSIVSGWLISYYAVKSSGFENIFISSIEVFESVPVISFFPIVLTVFIFGVGGPLGVELAADFLVFTAVVWNIWMAQYQAFKTIPREMLEVSQNFKFTFLERMRFVFIPFSIPRISANLFPSVSDAFFYITVSEVFAVGVHNYHTFGVGTVLDAYVASGQWSHVTDILIILGIAVVLIIFALRDFSRRAVAKYALDTDVPIVRRGRLNLRESIRLSAIVSSNPLQKLAQYNRARRSRNADDIDDYDVEIRNRNLRPFWIAISATILALLLYGAYRTVSSVSVHEWHYLISQTPTLLLFMLYDYARVAVITGVAFVFAIFVGYHLAVSRKAELIGIPIMQVFSSYPAPTYFPFLYLAIYPFIYSIFGQFSGDFFVLFLGFISTFYYIFYSFWMGVKAMPSEYHEIMENLNLSFFQKMRLVIMPSTFPYLISGISSTINSTWGGLEIGEFWPEIIGNHSLSVGQGLMKVIAVATNSGNIALAAWASLLFGIVVVFYSILFTRKMMDLAKNKYVAEEGIYAA